VIGELIELLTDRLNDPTVGVNALLTAMVAEFGWTAGDVPVYQQILGETADLSAALGQLPQVPEGHDAADYFPALLVGNSDASTFEPAAKAGPIRDGEVELMLRDADRAANPAAGTKAALRRCRAICRVIERWTQGTEAAREQDGIYVINVESLSVVPAWQAVGDALCTAGVRVRFKVRDNAP